VDDVTHEFRSSIEAFEVELKRISKTKELKPERLARLLLQPNEEVRKKINEIFNKMTLITSLEEEVLRKIFETVMYWFVGILGFYLKEFKVKVDHKELLNKLLEYEKFNKMMDNIIIRLYLMFILAYLMIFHMLLEPFITSSKYNVRYNVVNIKYNSTITFLVKELVDFAERNQLIEVVYAFIARDFSKYEGARDIYEDLRKSLIAHIEMCMKIVTR